MQKKEKKLFFLLYEQGALHLPLLLDLENYVAGPGSI